MTFEIYGSVDSAQIILRVPKDSYDAVHAWLKQAGFNVRWPAIRPAGSFGTIILLPVPEEDDG